MAERMDAADNNGMQNSSEVEQGGELHSELRDGVNSVSPIFGRKYTMTHSDETGERFVVIGTDFAKERMNDTRDDVTLQFGREGRRLVLEGSVLIDGENIPSANAQMRYNIFLRQMPMALNSIRTGDSDFFEHNPFLDNIHVVIWFKSMQPEYNKFYDFGPIGNYKEG